MSAADGDARAPQPGPERRQPSIGTIRTVGALIVAAGLVACAMAIFTEQLGLAAEAAEGTFGWKRTSLLAVGLAVTATGVFFLAYPRAIAARIDTRRVRSLGRAIVSPSDRQLGRLALGLLALLGLALLWTRLIHIEQSLWHDEAYTVLAFSGAGPEAILFRDSFHFNNHALYNLLSWLTVNLVGDSEAAYRLWSVLPGIAAIGLGAWWTWRRIGPVASVVFATIAVAGPLHLEFTTQARGYGLALLLATVLLIAADHLTRAYSLRALLGFVGTALAGIWTLIIFAILFVGQALALLRWRRLRLPVIVALGAAGLLSIAFYGPSVGGLPGAGVSGTRIPLSAALLLDRPLEWLVIPTATLLTGEERAPLDGSGVLPDAGWGTWLDVTVFALLVVGLVALWRRGDGGLALLLVVPPLFFNLYLSLDDQATTTRHQMFLLPYVVAPVAAGIAAVGQLIGRNRFLRPVAVAVGVAGVLALSEAIVNEENGRALPRENFKEVANVVNRTGVETIVTDSLRMPGLSYYLGDRVDRLASESLATRICDGPDEVVYIHHPAFSGAGWSPESLECIRDGPAVRIGVPQRARGRVIEVWIVNPQADEGRVDDDLPYVPDAGL